MSAAAGNSCIIDSANVNPQAEDSAMPSIYRKRGSPYWYANIKAHIGPKKRIDFPTKVRATDAASKKEAMRKALQEESRRARVADGEITIQEFEASKRGRVEIAEILPAFLGTIKSAAQRDETRNTIERFIREHPVRVAADFGAPSIVGQIARFLIVFQKSKVSGRWIRKRLYHLQRFGDWLWRHGYIVANESEKAEPLESEQQRFIEHRAFTVHEAERLTAAPETNLFTALAGVVDAAIPPRRQLYYRLRLFTGARDREALRLRRGDLDLSNEPTIYWPAAHTKNRHECVMPLAPGLAAAIAEQVGMMHSTARLFADVPAGENQRYAMMRRDLVAVGIIDPLIIGRSFRKTFCTWLEVAGVELGTRMKLRRDVGQGSAKLASWTYSDDRQAMRVLRDGVTRLEAWYAEQLQAPARMRVHAS